MVKKQEVKSVEAQSEEQTHLLEEEKATLAKLLKDKQDTQGEAEKAYLRHEVADLKYKYFIANIYVKYGLNMTDQIADDGEFQRAKESS